MDVETVAADLAKHEAVCAERWKTAFNRFDDIDNNVKRIESIINSSRRYNNSWWRRGYNYNVAHGQLGETMEMEYSKKDIKKAPKVKKERSLTIEVKVDMEVCGL